MAPGWEALRKMSDQELIEMYDRGHENVVVAIDFVRRELSLRETQRQTEAILSLTRRIVRDGAGSEAAVAARRLRKG